MRSTIRLTSILLLGALCSCPSPPRGTTTIVHWDPGTVGARMVLVSTAGEYALYSSAHLRALFTVTVNRGDPIGFKPDGNSIIAIAGEHRTQLPIGTYFWARR